MNRMFAALAASLLAFSFAPAAELPITSITPYPAALKIRGSDNAPQLLITGKRADGRLVDLTGAAAYSVANAKIVRISSEGRVFGLANGTTEITATVDGMSVRVPVSTQDMDHALPINFANHVVPVFTKLSCNSGGCHGKIQGQNGFRLSLLGFDPAFDYENLLKEGRGRRVFAANPDASLLLTKASGTTAHGGGKKMDVSSEEYKIVRRWIASGTPYGEKSDPNVVKIQVVPGSRVIDRNARQQLAVYAHYSDGSVEDVTRRAQYESNDTDVATVSEAGLVNSLNVTGQAGIMIRYQGNVSVFRTVVPRPGQAPKFSFPEQTVVDKHTVAKWRELGIAPSELSTDEQFVRRVCLDITGTLPDVRMIRDFTAGKDPKKRDKLIDKLVDSPEYSYYFANKWADVLRVKRRNQQSRAFGTFGFHTWIREAVAADKPYDEFVRDIVCAIGDESKSPPAFWYREVQTPENFVDDVSQVFLGQRLACANCHHHPYERWSQDDYWGIASFFARVGKKNIPVPGQQARGNREGKLVLYVKTSGRVTNKRTNQTATMKPLDGEPMEVPSDEDPRQAFADWLTSPKNPFFAKAVANRYWAHFFGKGIVDPLDDMRVTNPPSNPELLDALAANLIANKYSLKALVKTICKSRTYQLSSTPNEFNKTDKQSYARYYPKRLQAEVLFDAVCKLTGSPSQFNGLPRDKFAPSRAIMLPDESYTSYFLDVAGRPQRISACECERVNEASLAMSLHLLNSNDIQGRLSSGGGRADAVAKDPRPDAEKIEELFLLAIAKKPNAGQLKAALENIQKNGEKGKKLAYENILWALLNTKAFLFNQ